MMGYKSQPGRLRKAKQMSRILNLPIVANDGFDPLNNRLFKKTNVENIGTALNTRDEVYSALVRGSWVLFITSPDHLPRVVKEVMILGGYSSVFMASETQFSTPGVLGVEVLEPSHLKPTVVT